ncbi:MAG: DUF4260 domain-containing protein [Aggregatilineales bacterium]
MIQATAQTQITDNTDMKIGAVSMPRILLHLEGAAVLLTALVLYSQHSGDWLVFALLLFVPDVSMVGYLMNKKMGAMLYNGVHTYPVPLVIIGTGLALTQPMIMSVGLILLAHIGIDRMVGYGLKYETDFKDTHMGRI